MSGLGDRFEIGTQLALLRSRAAGSALVIIAVAAVTAALVALSPTRYEARVALVAQPVTQASPTGETFSGFVTLALPALVEFVHSTSALSDIRSQVPGAPSIEDLEGAIDVDRTPDSAVVTIVVTASSTSAADGLARATVAHVVAAGLLSPVAVLRPLDARPTVRELRPGLLLVTGLSLGAGIAAAMGFLAALQLWLPAAAGRLRRSLDAAGVDHPVILIDSRDDRATARFRALGALVEGSARLLPVAVADPGNAAARLRGEAGIVDRSGPDTPVIAVAARDATHEDLAAAWSALPRPAALVAVVLD